MSQLDVEVDVADDEVLLLDSEKSKPNTKNNSKTFRILKIIFLIVLLVALAIFSIGFIAQFLAKNVYGDSLCADRDATLDKNILNNTKTEDTNTTESDKDISVKIPTGFELVSIDKPEGPITVDREKDDGTKLDYYELINPESDSFYYNQTEFNNLKNITYKGKEVYFCELGTGFAPENYKAYVMSCPLHYTIVVDKVFYGRHANDNKHCNHYYEGRPVEEEFLTVDKECGNEPIANVKEICEGRNTCSLRPGGSHFTDSCESKYKYLHITYHCVKDKKLKKENISVVMYSNIIKPNSIYENAISAFYQYSKINGYDFEFNTYRYDTERQIFFMKLNSILEKIMIGLKEKKYDWVL